MAKKQAKKQDTSTKTYMGARISNKQFKLMLANAATPEARRAIKDIVLGEPLKYYTKKDEEANEPEPLPSIL